MAQGSQRGHYYQEVAELTRGEESATKPQAIKGIMEDDRCTMCALLQRRGGGEGGEGTAVTMTAARHRVTPSGDTMSTNPRVAYEKNSKAPLVSRKKTKAQFYNEKKIRHRKNSKGRTGNA